LLRSLHNHTSQTMKTRYDENGLFVPSKGLSASDPVESEISIQRADEQASADAQISVADRNTIRILIIDDDRTLREGCASVLQVEGYNVTTCGRGDEALDMVRRASYDIVMVDLYMTPVPGMEILKSVLTIRPGTIVLVMTGNPSVASSMEALRCGAWDYLPKPFSGTHLQVLLGQFCRFATLAALHRASLDALLHDGAALAHVRDLLDLLCLQCMPAHDRCPCVPRRCREGGRKTPRRSGQGAPGSAAAFRRHRRQRPQPG